MKTAVIRHPANHPLHLFLSMITFGLWVPVWIVVAIIGRRETVTMPDPQYFNVTAQRVPPRDPYPPSWRAGDPNTMLYAGSYYRWNHWTNRWDRTYG